MSSNSGMYQAASSKGEWLFCRIQSSSQMSQFVVSVQLDALDHRSLPLLN